MLLYNSLPFNHKASNSDAEGKFVTVQETFQFHQICIISSYAPIAQQLTTIHTTLAHIVMSLIRF